MMELKKMLLFVLMRQALQTVFEKRKANEMLQVQTGDRWYYKVRSSLRETVMVVVVGGGGNLKQCHGIIAYHFPTLAHIAVSKDSSTSEIATHWLIHQFSIFGSQEKTKVCADQRKDNGKYRNIYRKSETFTEFHPEIKSPKEYSVACNQWVTKCAHTFFSLQIVIW